MNRKPCCFKFLDTFLSVLVVLFLLFTADLKAARTWDGNGVSPTVYGNADNWVENAVPTPSDIIFFPNVANTNPTLSNTSPGAAYGVLGVDFNATTANYTFTIQNIFRALNVGTSGIVNSGGQSHVFNVNNTGILRISGPVNSSNLTFNVSQGTLSFLDQGSVSSGTFNVDSSGFINFTDDSTSFGGTFNVGSTGTVRFIDSSNPAGGTFNLLTAGNAGGNILFNIDGVVENDLVINASDYAEISILGINNLEFNGVLTGGGGLLHQALFNIDGTGIVEFTSNSSGYLGDTILEAGPTLVFTGRLGGVFDGLSGSRLEGSGTFGDDVNILGTISPQVDGLAATINILGDLTISNGTYEVLFDENGNNSLINAATATINNSELNVQVETLPELGVDHLVLSASTVSGPFTIFAPNLSNPLVDIQQIYKPSAIFIRFVVPRVVCVTNSNELNVLISLASNLPPNSDQTIILNNLINLPCEAFDEALNQMSGAQYTNYVEVAYNATNRFSNRLRMATRSRIDCPVCCCNENYFSWVDIGGGHSDYNGDTNAAGLDDDYYSVAAGCQVLNCSGVTLGLAAYYENDDLDFDLNGSAKVNNYQAAIYTAYQNGRGYVLGNFIYGANQFKMKRNIEFNDINRTATSSSRLYSGTFYGEIGLTNYIGCLATQQYIGTSLGYYYQDKIHESGADSINLRIQGEKNYRYDFIAGSRFQLSLPSTFSLELDINYRHRFNADHVGLTINFVDVEQAMKIRGFKLHKDGVEGSLVLLGNICGNWQWYLRAAGEAWSSYNDYSGTMGLIFRW